MGGQQTQTHATSITLHPYVDNRHRHYIHMWTTDTDTTSVCGQQTQTLHPYMDYRHYIHTTTFICGPQTQTHTTSILLHPYVDHRHRRYIHTTTSMGGPQTQTIHPYNYIHGWTTDTDNTSIQLHPWVDHRHRQYIHTTTSMGGRFDVGCWRPPRVQEGERVQELCESRGGHPGLSVLTRLMVSVDVKQH